MSASPQKIEVEFDSRNDLLIARPKWDLKTRADVQAWHKNWIDVLAPYAKDKRPDVVVVLDEFRVSGEAIKIWGEYRADLNSKYFGISYRVNPESRVRIAILTSGVAYNSATAEAPTIQDAVKAILAVRRNAGP